MRHSSLAVSAIAGVAACAALGGCGGGAIHGNAGVRKPGAELMAQEAPPAIGRPIIGGERSPRMQPGDISGRYTFYWTRAEYTGLGRGGFRGRRGQSWTTDYPKADQQFLIVLKNLVRLRAYDWENPVSLADPDLRRFPLVYAVEVGHMDLSEAEVQGLRSYLAAGGFLIVDDFWGTREWQIFEANIERVLPGRPIIELGADTPVFSAYYQIDTIEQVPNINNAIRGQTSEQDGFVPHFRGIFDDEGRLMVAINWNTDLGDAWEWAEDPAYPLQYSSFACELGANMIVYAMSH
jgi:Domain of unknown function (DUF4159)